MPVAKKRVSWSVEEMIGTNLLPKVGIVLLVLGLAYLTNYAWGAFSHVVRALILYASAAALLGCGVFVERKEKYAILGRVLIGGGWSVLFLSTYAINHVEAVRLFSSAVVDLVLMLIVASAMVWHTLKYNSQLVTGVAFLLGFAAVTLNPDPPFNLIAGALLAIGLTVIVVRRQWFELEVFGILAGYLTHGWWLFTVFGLAGVRSEEHTSELQSPDHLVCRLLLEKKKKTVYVMMAVAMAIESIGNIFCCNRRTSSSLTATSKEKDGVIALGVC